LYNGGRIATYTMVGGLMGFTGSFVNVSGRLAGLQNLAMTLAGVFMILLGLGIIGIFPAVTAFFECRYTLVLDSAGGLFRRPGLWKHFPLGLILGLMPCGLSYSIFISAAGSGNGLAGMTTSLCFGVGTLPALLCLSFAVSFFSARLREALYRVGGLAVIASGLYYLWISRSLYAHM